MSPETLVTRASAVGLDGVAVTDHNTMAAVEPARRAATDLLVIPGEEIDTPDGQIIGLFLTEPIEPWQSPAAVIDAIHAQGGLALAPHPFDPLREGLASIGDHADALDAIEGRNSRCLRDRYNDRAVAFAREHDLPITGGSDAHFAREVGTAFTRASLDADPDTELSGDAVQRTIERGKVEPAGRRGTPLVHAGTKCVKLYDRVRRAIGREQ